MQLTFCQSQTISSIRSNGCIADTGGGIFAVDVEGPVGLVLVPGGGNAVDRINELASFAKPACAHALYGGVPAQDFYLFPAN